MISKRIYEGATAEKLGLTETQYRSRKAVVDRFAAQWDESQPFEEAFLPWLEKDQRVREDMKLVSSKQEEQQRAKAQEEEQLEEEAALTFGEMFAGLGRSLTAIVKSGVKTVGKEEHERRYTICLDCKDLNDGRCMLCGCFMKLKSKFAAMHCPVQKW